MSKPANPSVKTVRDKVATVVSTGAAAAALGPQGQLLLPTITQSSCGSEHIGAGFLVMPPARVAKPHYHEYNELIIFFLEGFGIAFIGEELEPHYVGPGDFLYIPEGVLHFGINLSETQRHTAIEVRTDPHFNEDVVLVPEMEAQAIEVAAEYRRRYAAGTLEVPETWKNMDSGPYRHQEVY